MRFTTLTVHYSATFEDQDVDVKDIDQWHKAKGYSGVGYHWFIKLSGLLQEGRLLSRTGAHVKGKNTNNLGICFAGGLRRETGKDVGVDTRNREQNETLEKTIREMLTRFPTITKVVGHKDLGRTQCPGFDVGMWWSRTTNGVYVPGVSMEWEGAPVSDTPVLFRGVKNQRARVKELQANLNRLGSRLLVDGIFGKNTENAVKNFEIRNGLVPDGRVGTAEQIQIQKLIKR